MARKSRSHTFWARASVADGTGGVVHHSTGTAALHRCKYRGSRGICGRAHPIRATDSPPDRRGAGRNGCCACCHLSSQGANAMSFPQTPASQSILKFQEFYRLFTTLEGSGDVYEMDVSAK